MKGVITGGSGFLGNAIAKYLEIEKYEVLRFDTSYSQGTEGHRRGSILNPEDLDAVFQGADVVFHIAGVLGTTELISDNNRAVDVNIKGTLNVLDACQRNAVRRVFYPTKPNDWLNTYSITKKSGEDFAKMYAQIHGLDVRILRWLNAYGPGQKAYPVRKAVPIMIVQALQNHSIDIWGTGEQPVDLIYTDDLARNTVRYTLMEDGDAEVRDTGNTIRLSVNELAELIKEMIGSRSRIIHRPMRLGEDQEKPVELLSGETAANILQCEEDTKPLKLGLAETIEYYAQWSPEYRENILRYYSRDFDAFKRAA